MIKLLPENCSTRREIILIIAWNCQQHTWSAARFKPVADIPNRTRGISKVAPVETPGVDFEKRTVIPPPDLLVLLDKHKAAYAFFQALSFTNKKEYVAWIASAKKEGTCANRVLSALDKLKAGKKNPSEK